MHDFVVVSIIASVIGLLARLIMLRSDYRQYPSSPHSILSHIVMAAIASVLGAVAVPAFLEKEYTAVTFLTLAATQFREIRSVERESLQSLEDTELVERGQAYIEDTAKKFESRNYVAMASSFGYSVLYYVFKLYFSKQFSMLLSFIFICAFICFLYFYMRGGRIEQIAKIEIKEVKNNGPLIIVDDVVLVNIGNKKSQEIVLENAVGIVLTPINKDAEVTLSNLGQRQAILSNCSIQLGIKKDVDEPDFTPLARKNPQTGKIAILLLCMEDNKDIIIDSVARTPILESAKRKPSMFYKNLKKDKKV